MTQDGGDRGQRDAGGYSGDAEGVAKTLWTSLRSGYAGVVHDSDYAAVPGCPGPRPDGFRGASGGDVAQAVDELEYAQVVARQRDFAPVFGATFEGPDADGAGVEIDIEGPQGEELADAGAGVREGEGEGLVLRLWLAGCGGKETGSFFCREVFAAVVVD